MRERVRLGVNIDHVATVRNARGGAHPDPARAAEALCPAVTDVLAALRAEGALLARMSGSGATCFGIFADASAAGLAAYRIGTGADWWITPTALAAPPAPF